MPIIGGGGSGSSSSAAVTLISTATFSGASLDLTGLSQGFTHLRLVILGRLDDAAQVNIKGGVRFNNDSGANYDWNNLLGSGGTASTSSGSANTSMQGIIFPAAGADANQFWANEILIPYYTATTFQKTICATTFGQWDTTAGHAVSWIGGGRWRNTAAINRITVIDAAGGNFVAGSQYSLYGLS